MFTSVWRTAPVGITPSLVCPARCRATCGCRVSYEDGQASGRTAAIVLLLLHLPQRHCVQVQSSPGAVVLHGGLPSLQMRPYRGAMRWSVRWCSFAGRAIWPVLDAVEVQGHVAFLQELYHS